MTSTKLPGGGTLALVRGDLVDQRVDAIVNAAQPMLTGGGGVDGAIHRAAGPRFLAACEALPVVDGVRCPTGHARITPGFDLPARWVIHTVGPIFARSSDPEGELFGAYRTSFRLAHLYGIRTIALPAVSCGVYGFPPALAAPIATAAARAEAHGFTEVRFVLFGDETWEAWRDATA